MAQIKVGFQMVSGVVSGWITGVMTMVDSVITVFTGITDFIAGVFTGNWEQAWNGIVTIFSGIFTGIGGLVKTPLNMIIGLVNGAIEGINGLGLKIPDWIPLIGGKEFSINVPEIPMLARGTNNWRGGLAITQEKGGEIMDLPSGTRVYPHDKSIQMARSEGKGTTNITIAKLADKIEVRSESDIEALAEKFATKLAEKLEKVKSNSGKVVLA